jgi:hypothetical protein
MAQPESKSVAITKVVVKMGKMEVSMTVEEAKELQDVLNKTFCSVEVRRPIYIDYPVYRPYTWWSVKPDYTTGVVYCSSTSGTSATSARLTT